MATTTEEPPKTKGHNVKLVLLGEAAVGKSSLVIRFVTSKYHENKEPTIGAAFLTESIALSNRVIKFEIWDTAGQERFASLAPMYYRNAKAAVVVYDITKPSSLLKAKHWVAELQRQATPNMIIALVGNKLDLCTDRNTENDTSAGSAAQSENDSAETNNLSEDSTETNPRKISTAEAKAYAEEESLLFFEASAKLDINVRQIFEEIAKIIPETELKSKRSATNATSNAMGGAANRADEARVNLTDSANKQQESCAC